LDNVTHAFVGAAIAESVLPRGVPAATRRVFLFTGVAAASAPDLDLVSTGLTEPPLGFLLHHRGHTHTLPGLIVLGVVIFAVLRFWSAARIAIAGLTARCVVLIAVALVSHLLMDAANSYGTHLWFPFSSGWVFGDAVFVLEPWFWVILGTVLAANVGRRAWRIAIWLLTLLPLAVVAYTGLTGAAVTLVLLLAAVAIALWTRSWHPRRRAGVALAGAAAIFVIFFGLSRLAKHEAVRAIEAVDGATVVDVALDSNPAVPWCWSLLTLERLREGPPGTLVARRGTFSLFPRFWPATSCASARLITAVGPIASPVTNGLVWHRRWLVDVEKLRELNARDCRVRAWLQFARMPFVSDGRVADLRFENPFRANFSSMTVREASGCPSHLTNWDPPRRDLLLH
jgi:inner membrane protein